MISRPPPRRKTGPAISAARARSSHRIVPRSLQAAYLELEALARDRRAPVVLRGLSRVAAVAIHRILLIHSTGTDRQIDADGYLAATLDTARTTSHALLELTEEDAR